MSTYSRAYIYRRMNAKGLTAGVRRGVSTGEGDELISGGSAVPAAGDLELGTLGVELCGEGVQSNRLEADEVVARRDGRGDRRRPGRVLVDHLASRPVAVADRARQKAGLVDLEPLERRRVHASARATRALRQVGELCASA